MVAIQHKQRPLAPYYFRRRPACRFHTVQVVLGALTVICLVRVLIVPLTTAPDALTAVQLDEQQQQQEQPPPPPRPSQSKTNTQQPHQQSESTTRITDIVLMGQFNYAQNISDVIYWYQKWSQWFQHVLVFGPFSPSDIELLSSQHHSSSFSSSSIPVFLSDADEGYYSPMWNLARALQHYKDSDQVKGVIYLHDDTLLNITYLRQAIQQAAATKRTTTTSSVPKNNNNRNANANHNPAKIILASFDASDPRIGLQNKKRRSEIAQKSYSIHYRRRSNHNNNDHTVYTTNRLPENHTHTTTTATPTTISNVPSNWTQYYSTVNGKIYQDPLQLQKSLRRWRHEECLYAFSNAVWFDNRTIPYMEEDDDDKNNNNNKKNSNNHHEASRFVVPPPSYGGTDFLYVTTSLADAFAPPARLFYDHKVFLECGFAKIIDILRRQQNATVIQVPLCTGWGLQRDRIYMLRECSLPVAVIHPYKISKGWARWTRAFDWAMNSTVEFVNYPSTHRHTSSLD